MLSRKFVVSCLSLSGIIGCFIWMYFEPGFEPALGIIAGIGILVADFLPDADLSKWRDRGKLLIASSLLVLLVATSLVYLGLHLQKDENTIALDAVEDTYMDLYDTSKDLLRVLQPSEANTFSASSGLANKMKELAETQLLPMNLVEIVEGIEPVVGEGEITLRLTNYGKKVRGYVLTSEGYKPTDDIFFHISQTD